MSLSELYVQSFVKQLEDLCRKIGGEPEIEVKNGGALVRCRLSRFTSVSLYHDRSRSALEISSMDARAEIWPVDRVYLTIRSELSTDVETEDRGTYIRAYASRELLFYSKEKDVWIEIS